MTQIHRHRHVGIGNAASFSWERHGRVIALWDDWSPPARTVTNDVEAVVAYLNAAGFFGPPNRAERLVYRDSDGRWDEIVVDRAGRFVSFEAIGAETAAEAILAVSDG